MKRKREELEKIKEAGVKLAEAKNEIEAQILAIYEAMKRALE